jgi:hypothetical protein
MKIAAPRRVLALFAVKWDKHGARVASSSRRLLPHWRASPKPSRHIKKDADADPAGDGTGRIDCPKDLSRRPAHGRILAETGGQLLIKPLEG